jgi:adenosylcobinamide-GDP ribazoletransferase
MQQISSTRVYGPWHPALILTAMGFLTRIPMPRWVPFNDVDVAYSSRWFSLIGLLIGSLGAGMLWLLTPLFGQGLAVAITLIGLWRLTGGFHEDGLADLCDGFGGSWQRERKLEIMKDSQIGTYGVLALIGSTAIKLLVLSELPLMVAMMAIVIAHVGGRAVSGWVPMFLTYARVGDQSKTPQRRIPASWTVLLLVWPLAVAPLLMFSSVAMLCILLVWALTLVWMLQLMQRHIQGYTGDTLGATEQIIEITTLLSIVALANTGVILP